MNRRTQRIDLFVLASASLAVSALPQMMSAAPPPQPAPNHALPTISLQRLFLFPTSAMARMRAGGRLFSQSELDTLTREALQELHDCMGPNNPNTSAIDVAINQLGMFLSSAASNRFYTVGQVQPYRKAIETIEAQV